MDYFRIIRLFFLGAFFFLTQGICESVPALPSKPFDFESDVLRQIQTKANSKLQKIDFLEGLTNKNYLFTFQNNNSYVVKVFNPKGGNFTQRRNERDNQNQVWKIHLAPKMELLNEEIGLIEYITPIKKLEINEETLYECAKLIAKLHYSDCHFIGRFDFEETINYYSNICTKEKNLSGIDEGFTSEILRSFQLLSNALSNHPIVPCHNDLHLSNFLIGNEGIRIIDWEESSMNDPAWDISYFLIASFVPEELWSTFLQVYTSFMPEKDPLLVKRIKLYKPFILVKIGLFLKSFINLEGQQAEDIEKLTNLCLNGAKKIFYAESYQNFLDETISNVSKKNGEASHGNRNK